jgi:hypothetical protein
MSKEDGIVIIIYMLENLKSICNNPVKSPKFAALTITV